MTDPYRNARPGEPVGQRLQSASQFNTFVDASRWVRDHAASVGESGLPVRLPPGVVRVQNSSTQLIGQYRAVGISGVVIDPEESDQPGHFATHPVFAGRIPTTADAGKFAITLEPIDVGEIGFAVVVGVVCCLVNVVAESDPRCDFDDEADDATILKTGPIGAGEILYKEGGTGEKWALIRIGFPFACGGVAKATSGIAAISGSTPGSATCEIYRLASGVLVATGHEVTIYNSAGAVATGAFIQFKSDTYGNLWVDVENCT